MKSNNAKLNDDVDALFKLPLAEFIDARNALAKSLKQSGRAGDANLVKTLVKPSVSAWTVNQLYWNHRDEFEMLLASGRRFRKAQTSGKIADMRDSLQARSEALLQLSDLATSLLSDAGHNPSTDMIRRITTTLEALTALTDGPTLGRLSQDVDPPGFESLASFIPATGTKKQAVSDTRRSDESRNVKIAAAKFSLQAAKKALADARVRVQSLESAKKTALADVKQAEKQLREAEERFKKARAASEAASQRSKNALSDAEEAAKAVEDAKRAVDKATKELESLFSEPGK